MTTKLRRATLTLEIEFPEGERPVLGGRWPQEVTGLLVTWQRGMAVDSGLSWHWFPMQATTLTARGSAVGSWHNGSLHRDGAAPQWVRDAVAQHRPEDEGALALRVKVLAQREQRIGGQLDPAEVLAVLEPTKARA